MAFYNYDTTDPLGIDRQSRGLNSRFRYAQEHPGSSFGPLPSAGWSGYFQSLQDAGVSRLGDSSTRPGFGSQFGALPDTYDPNFQASAPATMPSNQIGVPGETMPNGVYGESIPAMDALTRATGGGGFVARRSAGPKRMRVQTQRGTTATNQTRRG